MSHTYDIIMNSDLATEKEIKNSEDPVTLLLKRLSEKLSITPYEVNDGFCTRVAQRIEQEVPQARETCYEMITPELPPYSGREYNLYKSHSWIEYNGKHYDIEAPDGIKEWKELPIFQNRRS